MATDLLSLLKSSGDKRGRELEEGTIQDVLNFALLLTNAPADTKTTIYEREIPGSGSFAVGSSSLTEAEVILAWTAAEYLKEILDTSLHEGTHTSKSAAARKVTLERIPDTATMEDWVQSTMINDLVEMGLIAKSFASPSLEGLVQRQGLVSSIAASAKEHGLPSSSTGNIEEARANTTAYLLGNALGVTQDEDTSNRMESFMADNPEFTEWVASGLGGRYIGVPRLKSHDSPDKPPEESYQDDPIGVAERHRDDPMGAAVGRWLLGLVRPE